MTTHGGVQRRTDWPTSSWWLQMTWCQLGTRSSAATMLILQWLKYGDRYVILSNIFTALHALTHLPLDKMAAFLAADIFKCIFLNENCGIPSQISLKYVPSPIDNRPALFQVMAWCQTGNKPLPEPMMTQFIDAYMRHYREMSSTSNAEDNRSGGLQTIGFFVIGGSIFSPYANTSLQLDTKISIV